MASVATTRPAWAARCRACTPQPVPRSRAAPTGRAHGDPGERRGGAAHAEDVVGGQRPGGRAAPRPGIRSEATHQSASSAAYGRRSSRGAHLAARRAATGRQALARQGGPGGRLGHRSCSANSRTRGPHGGSASQGDAARPGHGLVAGSADAPPGRAVEHDHRGCSRRRPPARTHASRDGPSAVRRQPAVAGSPGPAEPRAAPGRAPARDDPAAVGCAGCRPAAGASSPTAIERRLLFQTAPTITTTASAAMPYRRPSLASVPTDRPTTAGAISSATRFITLISGLIAGPAVSLNGSPTVSPMTVASCASEPLPPWCAVLDDLLGVVPGAAGVGQEDRHQGAGADRAGEVGRRAGRRRGRSRPRSGPGRRAGRGWPARAASRGCRCRRPCRTPGGWCPP